MDTGSTVRKAQTSDAAGIAGLMAQLGYPSCADEMAVRLERVVTSPSDLVLVSEQDGDISGLIAVHLIPMLHADGSTGRVTAFIVSEAHRGQGIGTELMRAAQEWAWSNNCRKLEVTPGTERTRAKQFYQRMGFAPANLRFLNERPEGT